MLIDAGNLTDYKIRHGAQGIHDGASKATLENEFGTANEEECIAQILEKGAIQESEVSGLMFRFSGAQDEMGMDLLLLYLA